MFGYFHRLGGRKPMTSILRPEERAAQAEIERSKKFDKSLKTGFKTAIGIGTTIAGGGLSSRLLPFLSEHIPTELALKGINKISPNVGQFLKKGMSQGLDVKDGLDFLKEKLSKQQEQPAKGDTNIIRQYSDKLDEFLNKEIQQGRQPLEAGALAQLQPQFKKIIDKMVKDHKTPFSSILETVFGSAQQPQQAQQQPQQQMQQAQQGPQNNDQAIMAALQKILQM